MQGESDDEMNDLFLLDEILEMLKVELLVATSPNFVGKGDHSFRIADRDADAHRAKIDSGDLSRLRGRRWFHVFLVEWIGARA